MILGIFESPWSLFPYSVMISGEFIGDGQIDGRISFRKSLLLTQVISNG